MSYIYIYIYIDTVESYDGADESYDHINYRTTAMKRLRKTGMPPQGNVDVGDDKGEKGKDGKKGKRHMSDS